MRRFSNNVQHRSDQHRNVRIRTVRRCMSHHRSVQHHTGQSSRSSRNGSIAERDVYIGQSWLPTLQITN